MVVETHNKRNTNMVKEGTISEKIEKSPAVERQCVHVPQEIRTYCGCLARIGLLDERRGPKPPLKYVDENVSNEQAVLYIPEKRNTPTSDRSRSFMFAAAEVATYCRIQVCCFRIVQS